MLFWRNYVKSGCAIARFYCTRTNKAMRVLTWPYRRPVITICRGGQIKEGRETPSQEKAVDRGIKRSEMTKAQDEDEIRVHLD